MKIYRLTKEGKRLVKIPRPKRDDLLDHLYEFKTSTLDELIAIDKDARSKLSKYIKAGYVEEITNV